MCIPTYFAPKFVQVDLNRNVEAKPQKILYVDVRVFPIYSFNICAYYLISDMHKCL